MTRYRYLLLLVFSHFSLHSFQQPVELVIQTGHSSDVNAVAFSKNGKYIASSCMDGSIKLWDARLGFEIFTFYGFTESASHVSFSQDNKYLLGTGSNMNVLWEVETGNKIAAFSSEEDEEKDAFEKTELGLSIISPGNQYCFSASNTIQRWDMKEFFNPVSTVAYRGHRGPVTGMCISPDNKYLVSVSVDSTIRIWDIATGKEIKKIKNAFEINDVAITPDGKKIITADNSTSTKSGIRGWDFFSGKQLSFVPDTRGYAKAISVSPDNRWLVAGTLLSDIILYRLPDLRQVSIMKGHTEWITGIAFSGDSKFIVSASADDAVKIWETNTGRQVRDFRKTIANIDNIVYENDHRLITATSSTKRDQETFTWEIDQGIGIKNRYHTKAHYSNREFLSIDGPGRTLLLSEDSAFNFYEPVSGKLSLRVRLSNIGTAILSLAGDYVIYQDRRTDSLFKLRKNSSKPVFFAPFPNEDTLLHFRDIDQFDFSQDGTRIIGAGFGPDAYIWDSAGKYLRNLNYLDADSNERKSGEYHENQYLAIPNAQINDIKFSPDGKWIAAGCRMPDPVATGGLIIVWDVNTGKILHWIPAHNYIIQSINWSPDGKFIITGANDKWMKVWRFEDFKQKDYSPVFEYQDDFTPTHTSFTRDNKWIIRGGIDGKIIIRDTRDYKTIATLIGLDENDFVAVTADQYYAASKKGTHLIAFRQGNKVFPAEQFDIKYNRPDKVMEALGSADTNLIRSYRQAYYKRIKKLGMDTSNFRNDFTAPEFDFANRDTIQYRQSKEGLRLRLTGTDSIYNLDRFNIWINEVPLYGQKGIPVLNNRNRFDTTLVIPLSEGENRIETSVINMNGTESYRSPLLINYTSIKPRAPIVRFLGIGIDQFANPEYNLQYSTKDIRDLALKLKAKYGKNIFIDTLFNQDVTVEKIRLLRQQLLTTNQNDKVIISYSGHGLLNKEFDYYLSTYAINFENPEVGGLRYDELENLLDSIPARRKLLLIDACHSGEVDKEELMAINIASDSLNLVKGLKPVSYKTDNSFGLKNSFELMQNLFVNVGKSTGATIISAAAGNQFALERNDLRNGVFTYSILEAMQKNKTIKVSALRKYVTQRVEELTNGMQQPTSRNETIASDWEIW